MRDSTNTGYLHLIEHVGDITVTEPDTVLEGLDIHGYVIVRAPNCVIRKCIIRGGKPITAGSNALLNITAANAGGYLVEDVTLIPDFPNVRQNGIYVNKPGRFRRIDLSGAVDGIVIYGNGFELADSYLHDFVTYPSDPAQGGKPSHSDGVQIAAGHGVRITGTTIVGANNAAIMVQQDAGVIGDLTIEGNYLDGGGATVNFGSGGAPKTNLIVRNNRFGPNRRNPGMAIIRHPVQSPLTESGNVWDSDGTPIKISRGA